jgi:hypothetical protein
MSFYDDASWLLIPEGIEEDIVFAQKPTNGLGDLTFTRASDATRTNSAGVIERTPWNLVLDSEMFSTAPWTKSSAGTGITPPVTANTSTSPIGTLTADRVQFNCTGTTFSDRSILFQTFTSAVVGRSYTFTIYIKANALSEVGKQLRFNVDSGTNPAQVITITADWTRYTFAAIATSTSINCLLETRGTVTTNTTADVLIWGAQLVEGTDAKPYFATTNRQDVPRLDYRNADGSVSTCPRLLLEPQRTNSIRNSTMVGAVAGSPGTLPTNWGIVNSLTQTIVAIGTENGLQYMDVRFNGTSGGTTILLNLESSSQIAASNGQMWTNSFYFKSIAAPTPPNSYNLLTIQRLSGVAGASFTQPFTATSTLARYTQTVTTNNPSITHIQPYLQIGLTLGATYDFTIRIAAPQMELGAYATTFIPTTTAAVTRLADAASKTGISSLIGQTEGTLFLEFDNRFLASYPTETVIRIDTSSGVNQVFLRKETASNRYTARLIVGSSTIWTITNINVINGINKIAIAYKTGDSSIFLNGIQSGSTSTAAFSGSSFDNLFFNNAGTMNPELALIQAALFPTRLTNAQLAEITTL